LRDAMFICFHVFVGWVVWYSGLLWLVIFAVVSRCDLMCKLINIILKVTSNWSLYPHKTRIFIIPTILSSLVVCLPPRPQPSPQYPTCATDGECSSKTKALNGSNGITTSSSEYCDVFQWLS